MSGGQRQRIALARAIIGTPKVLLLDEPLGVLDLKLREQMQHALVDLQRQLGITFVYVTHDQGEALSMSDRIAVMKSGTVQQIGTPDEIYYSHANSFVADFIGKSNVLRLAADAASNLRTIATALAAAALASLVAYPLAVFHRRGLAPVETGAGRRVHAGLFAGHW